MQKQLIESYSVYLELELGLTKNSVDAYLQDVSKLIDFVGQYKNNSEIHLLSKKDLQEFVIWLNQFQIALRTQARIISGIKSFFRFLYVEELIQNDPSESLETPRIPRDLPNVLSLEEIDAIERAIDLSSYEGHRNLAIIEVLYSCGLRVTELVNLTINDLFFDEGFIRVVGKGNKQRFVPVGEVAQQYTLLYINHIRAQANIKKGHEDILFLNRRGAKLTRAMIFTIIKKLATAAQINKKISPHTFRHSFATHLIEGGAGLRAVQEMLGHESILTTEIYTHIDKEFVRQEIMQHHPRLQKNKK